MEYIKLLILSMVPIIELRGAIPLGISLNLNPIHLYISCVLGSTIVAIPVVLMFRQVIQYLRKRKYFNKIIKWIDKKIEGRAKKLKAASIIGLIIFVGVPLPTTGSWSAAALASILKMRIKDAILGIFIGNAIAGMIMLSLSYHLINGMSAWSIITVMIIGIICTYVAISKKIRKSKIKNIEDEISSNVSCNE